MKFLNILAPMLVVMSHCAEEDETLYQPSEECVICMEKDPEICVRHCNHFCLCKSCSVKIKRKDGCPICRGKIDDLERIEQVNNDAKEAFSRGKEKREKIQTLLLLQDDLNQRIQEHMKKKYGRVCVEKRKCSCCNKFPTKAVREILNDSNWNVDMAEQRNILKHVFFALTDFETLLKSIHTRNERPNSVKCTKKELVKLLVFQDKEEMVLIWAEEAFLLTKEIESKFNVEKQTSFNVESMKTILSTIKGLLRSCCKDDPQIRDVLKRTLLSYMHMVTAYQNRMDSLHRDLFPNILTGS